MSLSALKNSSEVNHGDMAISKDAKVRDVMLDRVLIVDENTSVLDASKMMADNNVGAIIVESAIKEAIGIFTERDLLNRVVSKGKELKDTQIKDVMTPDFSCLQMDDDLFDIPKIMIEGKFRNLPVVNGHNVVGMISMTDIMSYLFKGE